VIAATARRATAGALIAMGRRLERRATSLRAASTIAVPAVSERPVAASSDADLPASVTQQLNGRSFGSYAEAVRGVLELLETLLPESNVVLGQLGAGEEAFRVIDAQGETSFRLSPGVAIPLDASFAVLVATEQRAIFSGSAAQPVFGSLDVRDTLVNGSYVGVPLQLSDTTAIGSLCAVARPTRRYTEQDLQLLTVMARLLAHEFECDRRQQELRQQAEEYREDATTDPLTGLTNRRGFLNSLKKEWQLSRRGTVVSYLAIADVDGLKATNDRFGHAMGDALLQDVARALTGAARVSDTVGRLGGDEFGVVLIGCDGAEDAAAFRVRAEERLASLVRDRPLPVTLSFGSHSLADARSPERAVALADRAMYEDKNRRKSARNPAPASTAPSG
jgi:diguanylate cyclase (GGDEF)-like protein